MQQKIIRMRLDRETKGALLYQEIDFNGKDLKGDLDGAVLRTIYIRKLALNGSPPPKLIAITLVEALQ